MGNSFNSSGDYRIEISGWGLDNSFFAERTDLLWTASGEKQVQLHRALPEGAIVFIRLLASEPSSGYGSGRLSACNASCRWIATGAAR